MPSPHELNIALHATAGTAALALGLVMLARRKGGSSHRRMGRVFFGVMIVALALAALGSALFRPDQALIAITALSIYLVWTGWRALRSRGAAPKSTDVAIAALALAGGVAFVATILSAESLFWKPQVTVPIAGALIAWSAADLAIAAFAGKARHRFWRLEHGIKMIAVVGALASAGAATLLPQFSPWTQVGPSVIASVSSLAYALLYGRRYWSPAPLLATA